MSTSAPSAESTPPASTASSRAFWPSFLKFWSSVKLGIVLMLSIAASAIIGTVVPQGDATSLDALKLSDTTKHLLLGIHANDVYYSGWFLTLLGLFFLNLMVATWVMVIPRLKVGLRKPPEVSVSVQERHHDNKVFLSAEGVEAVARVLKQHGYRVYAAKNGGVIAHKGRFSRFAPLVTHIGLFTILIGAILSGLSVYKAQVPLFEGEQVTEHQIINQLAQPRGILTPDHHDWSVRLDKFWMDYYTQDTVKQFYSTLSILKGTKVVARKTIWVNEPMVYDGVWFYQAFWGVGAVDLALDGKASRIEVQNGEPFGLKGSLSKLVTIGKGRYILYLPSERQPLIVMRFNGGGVRPEPVAAIAPGSTGTVEGVRLDYKGPAFYSGLQSKQDPGIPLVYTGFVIVMVGTALAFFSLRQVWVGPKDDGFLMSGKANRGHYGFRQELVRIATKLGATTNEPSHGA